MKASHMTSVTLSDGRVVKISEYPDGSVRLNVTGLDNSLRYAVTECFLPGRGAEAIIKLELLS